MSTINSDCRNKLNQHYGDRQTDRQTDGQTDRQTDIKAEGQSGLYNIYAIRIFLSTISSDYGRKLNQHYGDRQTDTWTNRQKGGRT